MKNFKYIFRLTLAVIISGALFNVPTSVAEEISWNNLDAKQTSIVAFERVNTYLDALSEVKAKPIIYLSSNAEKRDYKLTLTGMDRVVTLWSELINAKQLPVVLFTENDGEWVDEKQKELTGKWFEPDSRQSLRLKQYGCNIGGMYLPGVLFLCVKDDLESPKSKIPYGALHTFAHEYTHFMEMNIKNWIGHASGSGNGTRNTCWIEEGFATFYGNAVGASPYDPSGFNRREFLRSQTFGYDDRQNQPHGTLIRKLQEGEPKFFTNLMKLLENTPFPCEETQLAYLFGSLGAEVLVAIFGHESMIDFYKSSSITGDWRKSFLATFGIAVEDFYNKLAPYVASQLNESNFELTTPISTPSASSTPILTSPSPTPSAIASQPPPITNPIANKKTKKVQTITCVKGKKIKKITAPKAKCPLGYKKK